jgi:hypothetical protein
VTKFRDYYAEIVQMRIYARIGKASLVRATNPRDFRAGPHDRSNPTYERMELACQVLARNGLQVSEAEYEAQQKPG